MNGKVLSLAVLLLTGAASGALAQDQGGRDGGGRPPIQNGGPMYNAARRAQEQAQARPPQPAQPPQAQQPARPPEGAQQQRWRQDGHGPPSGWNRQDGGRPDGGRPQPGAPARGDHRGGDRRDWSQRGDRGPGGDRQNWGERGPDRHDGGRHDGDHRDWGGRDGDHRPDVRAPDRRPDDNWRQYERRPDWNRDHDRGRWNGQRWEPRRYPPIYNSPARYRGSYWRPPVGYYARSWRYGEILPHGWYGPDYQLLDWWAYDLPEPPPGLDWVRVGRDAVLVDYAGRIVQVVRLLFW